MNMIQNILSKICRVSDKFSQTSTKVNTDLVSEKVNKSSHSEKLIDNCLKIHDYFTVLQKALTFDEDNIDSFENNYRHIIDFLIEVNWKNHNIAETISYEEFHRILNSKK
ncbi:hypothetical protein Sta7437_4977 (plasmid) [Stanieria cyanosphaera PCC 7437]|uniref:Uncharacterized protein n=1 Tax=Stanieria cyanosphaera (strain ATCC 29371 / PCC 7437) TaxID=111780 RepID=K9Y2Y4_STAC7|nr:hypothetical protein [Stanieria cyanosphaera]AFZ38397.1 hypothetical protein Sta7437_4977 [Stanieria cyanosphaera PCC 7437]